VIDTEFLDGYKGFAHPNIYLGGVKCRLMTKMYRADRRIQCVACQQCEFANGEK
jgi:hypothetical protein